MVLSKQSIIKRVSEGSLGINPFDVQNLGPASYDLRLGFTFVELVPQEISQKAVKVATLNESYPMKTTRIGENDVMIIPPKAFVLATTFEYIKIPTDIATYVEGRSSIGRCGLQVQNAGFIDPGFEGQITLELFNASDVPLALSPMRRICQLVFFKLDEATEPYSGKYMYQNEATASRAELDYEVKK